MLQIGALPPSADPEFRSYRFTLGAIVFGLTTIGVGWLAASVGVTLFVRPPLPPGAITFSGRADDVSALERCLGEVRSLVDDLVVRQAPARGSATATDWQELGDLWNQRWRDVGAQCRFEELHDQGLGEAFDHMAWVHTELPEVHRAYVALLRSYFSRQQPRVEEFRQALETSRRTLELLRGKHAPTG